MLASSSESPRAIAAAIISSAKAKIYAGPDPLTAVTASCKLSSTVITLPHASRNPLTKASCSLEVLGPADMAAMPLPIKVGVFGITRITEISGFKWDEINFVFFPAANERTKAPDLNLAP